MKGVNSVTNDVPMEAKRNSNVKAKGVQFVEDDDVAAIATKKTEGNGRYVHGGLKRVPVEGQNIIEKLGMGSGVK